jgi:SAM-dependent MidA family methyltransferase
MRWWEYAHQIPMTALQQFPMTALQQFLTDAGGPVTVEAFMRWALYDPKHGYYARRIADVGRTGDFSTSATLSPALAQALAAWSKSHREEINRGGRWHLIEVGPGNGVVAAEILRSLGGWTRRRLTYHLVETSVPLAERQRESLREWGGGPFSPTLRWHTDLETALREADGAALIISNELVDAFPCAVFVRSASSELWREVGVCWDATHNRATETLIDLSTTRAAEVRASTQSLPLEIARVEIHFAFRDWLRSWRPLWKVGRMLTIDYGGPIEKLYHRRPRGTLRGYFRQQRIEGEEIYERAGHQDLTADVNFTDLIRWGEAESLRAQPLQTQRDFLMQWNALPKVTDAATAHLLDPLGAGAAFKVLEQIPQP